MQYEEFYEVLHRNFLSEARSKGGFQEAVAASRKGSGRVLQHPWRVTLDNKTVFEVSDRKFSADWLKKNYANADISHISALSWLALTIDEFNLTGDRVYAEKAVEWIIELAGVIGEPSQADALYACFGCGGAKAFLPRRFDAIRKSLQLLYEFGDCDQEIVDALFRSLHWHSEEMSEKYVNNNHGMMMNTRLASVGSKFPMDNKYSKIAFERSSRYAVNAFRNSGYARENSPEYHSLNVRLVQSALKESAAKVSNRAAGETALARVRAASKILTHLLRHDGTMPPVGDSLEARYKNVTPSTGTWSDDPTFAVHKSQRAYLSMICGMDKNFHKHVDDLSLTLRFDGLDVLIDGGRYSYDIAHPIRRHLEGNLAHSGLSVASMNGLSPSDWFKQQAKGGVEAAPRENGGCNARMSIDIPSRNVALERTLRYRETDGGCRLAVVDTVAAGRGTKWTDRLALQNWLLGPEARFTGLRRRLGEASAHFVVGHLEVAIIAKGRWPLLKVTRGDPVDERRLADGIYSPAQQVAVPVWRVSVHGLCFRGQLSLSTSVRVREIGARTNLENT